MRPFLLRNSVYHIISILQDALLRPQSHSSHCLTEEELFKRYNPDLQRRSLENRLSKQQDFDKFVINLKEYSKSDKPSKYYPNFLISSSSISIPICYSRHIADAINLVWEVQAEAEQKGRDQAVKDKVSIAAEIERQRKEVRDSTTLN